MTRPWTWVLADDEQVHASATDGLLPGVQIGAVCGETVVLASTLVDAARVNPCLSCLQLITAIDWAVGQVAQVTAR